MSCTSLEGCKVLDVECLSKYCAGCSKEGGDQKPHKCTLNYEGTSGGMEVAGAVSIFQRSVEKRGVKYINYLGDGDSKAFKAVQEQMPYDEPIQKLECVGHIQKRMGNYLMIYNFSSLFYIINFLLSCFCRSTT